MRPGLLPQNFTSVIADQKYKCLGMTELKKDEISKLHTLEKVITRHM